MNEFEVALFLEVEKISFMLLLLLGFFLSWMIIDLFIRKQ